MPNKAKTTSKPKSLPEPVRELTEAERVEVRALHERRAAQPKAPRFKSDGGRSFALADPPGVIHARVANATGTTHHDAATHLLGITLSADPTATNAEAAAEAKARSANAMGELLTGIAPRNEIEGMLAASMVASHTLAANLIARAARTERLDCLALYGNLSVKLLRLFNQQAELLARLRGQTGQQTVRVEHVTVQAGGQAIVGAVNQGGAGGCKNKAANNPMQRENDGAG